MFPDAGARRRRVGLPVSGPIALSIRPTAGCGLHGRALHSLFTLLALELFRRAPMRPLVCNHGDPGGVLIESMDNADVVYAAGRVRMVE